MVSEALIWIEKVYNILKENPYFDIYDAELSIDENDFVAQIIYEKSVKTGKYFLLYLIKRKNRYRVM